MISGLKTIIVFVSFCLLLGDCYATVAYDLACDKNSGFVYNPAVHNRVGYVTSFNGLGLNGNGLQNDLSVSIPFPQSQAHYYSGITLVSGPTSQYTANVVGVIETLSWSGGVGDAISIDFYVSQENAVQIKALQQATLKTTAINNFGFWIIDYDQVAKKWFEEFYPLSPPKISGLVAGNSNPALSVDLTPVPVANGIDVNVYKISIQVIPAANQQQTFSTATTSSAAATVKSWGLVVGTLGQQAVAGLEREQEQTKDSTILTSQLQNKIHNNNKKKIFERFNTKK